MSAAILRTALIFVVVGVLHPFTARAWQAVGQGYRETADPLFQCPQDRIDSLHLPTAPRGVGDIVGGFAGPKKNEFVVAGSGVWMSSDYALTWTQTLSKPVTSLTRTRDVLAAGTAEGVYAYRAVGMGLMWTVAVGGMPCPWVNSSRDRPLNVYAICIAADARHAIFESRDQGLTWKRTSRDDASDTLAHARCLVDDGRKDGLRVVKKDEVHVSRDEGKTWVRVR